jgi:hypothetical protein
VLIRLHNIASSSTLLTAGATALMAAAGRGRDAEVSALLANGADVRLKSHDGLTAAGWAAKYAAFQLCLMFGTTSNLDYEPSETSARRCAGSCSSWKGSPMCHACRLHMYRFGHEQLNAALAEAEDAAAQAAEAVDTSAALSAYMADNDADEVGALHYSKQSHIWSSSTIDILGACCARTHRFGCL